MYELKPFVVGKRLAIKTLQKLLSDHLKWHLPIRVRLKRDPTHDKGIVYIGGVYYAFKDIPGYQSTAYYARDRKEQEYYGHKDEMGAFAFNIACELHDKFGNNFDAAKHYLDNNLSKRAKKSCWHKYMKTFDWNHNHPVIRSMKKKIIRNLPYAQIGKPFKTPDHLTY